MAGNKKILIIAFHYPPEGGSGMQRTLKFSKYLAELGYRPYVVSVKERLYALKDRTLLKEVPPTTEVLRSRALNTKKRFSINGKFPDILGIPDEYWTWIFDGFRLCRKLLKRESIDVVYSTSPLHTAHLIGLIVKRLYKKPWIADFRDPWMGSVMKLKSYGQFRCWIEKLMEGQVIEFSDRIICNTKLMKKDFMRRYPSAKNSKFVVIPNGYDEADFKNFEIQPKGNRRLTFIHTGEVYSKIRNPLNLLKAVKKFNREEVVSGNRILVKFIGGGPYVFGKEFNAIINELGLEGCVEVSEHVKHSKCIEFLYDSDVLLLLQQAEEAHLQIPAKAYEYLRVGKPILAVCSEGATADLIKSLEAGIVVNDEVEAIKNAIKKLASGLECGFVNEKRSRYFERRNLTKLFVKVIEKIS